MQSVEEFIANLNKPKQISIERISDKDTLFTLYRSFIVYRPNILHRIINDQELSLNIHNKILEKFILSFEQMKGKYKKSFVCYKNIDNFFLLPKASLLRLVEYKIITNEQIEKQIIPYFSIAYVCNEKIYSCFIQHKRISAFKDIDINLTNNQSAIVEHIYANYINPNIYNTLNYCKNPGCILVAGTGIGKTRIGYGLICKLRRKALVIVPNNTAVMYQWSEEARKAINNYDSSNIYITYYGDGHSDLSGDIVIAIVNSIININGKLLDDFGITIFDECHSYCTTQFSKVFWATQSICSIGLTASPDDRLDGFDKSLPWFIGPYINANECLNFVNDNDIVYDVQINIVKYKPDDNKYISYDSNVRRHELIVMDPDRNKIIIDLLTTLMNEKRHIFVFCDRRIHCVRLSEMFKKIYENDNMNLSTKQFVCDGFDEDDDNDNNANMPVYIMMGESSQENIYTAKNIEDVNKGSIIFTTFSFCKQSIDFPRMNTIILAAPRKSGSKQIIGRILRFGSDINIVRKVYDIVDVSSPFKSQFVNRLDYYREKNYQVIFSV